MWNHLKQNGIKLPKITAEEIDKKVVPVLRAMEKVGIRLDVPVLAKLAKKTEKNVSKLEKEIHKIANSDFNIGSPSQVAEILFKKLKLPTDDLKKTKTGYSTGASELKKLEKEHEIIKPILEYRELSKLLSTYLLPLPKMVDKNSRLHTTYGQDTNTGRINSSNPNLQNIPIKGEWGSEIRKAFIASPGTVLIAADYSQIELRVVACLAGDTAMEEAFHQKEDIHTRTAAEIFNITSEKVTSVERRVAKTVNFGVLYGMSPYGLSQALGIDQEKAADYIKRYFEVHTGIKKYCEDTILFAKKNGYVETLFGYRRKLDQINSPYRNVAEAESRMAINAPVQGTAAEILKLAMIELDRKLTREFVNSLTRKNESTNQRINESTAPRMLLTIHDEIVLEAPVKEVKKVAKLVKEVMERTIKLCVPIEVEVEIGKNLGQLKKV
jgi:DNA polymerase-1